MTLKKIISIKNIGRFINSAAPGNPELPTYTLMLGANGFGKTTLCAILRSLKTGDSAHIIGRHTLGAEDSPTVKLLLPNNVVAAFDGSTWSVANPAIAIFDDVFVAENVHSGEVVEINHRRNLYHIIIGETGVSLAEEETRLAKRSREMTHKITATTNAVQPYIPSGMSLSDFIALPPDPDIDDRLAEQKRTVEAVHQAKQITDRSTLSEIVLPTLPDGFAVLLARTIDDIAQDAETRLSEHLVVHGMETDDGNWIAKGLEHADDGTCPFCGQNIQGLPLITAYRAIFSERYKALRNEIIAMRSQIIERFGDAALERLNTRNEQNKGAVEFWIRYCTFDSASLTPPDDIYEAIRTLGQTALALIERKYREPLEPIRPDTAFNNAARAYESTQTKAREIVDVTRAINILIANKKKETGTADVRDAEAEFTRRNAIKVRHTDSVTKLCADYVRFNVKKDKIDQRKNEIRARLDAHTNDVIKPYEKRINHYLDIFNTDFRITETKHGYPGGTTASTYQLVINNTAINLGDSHTQPDQPSFKNTLSAGDRTTLALAFFLAHLEADPTLAGKIVVFDDPFNSQDAFRRRQTVHEIIKIAKGCAQVIVLSHDATFLKQVWDKAPRAERVALNIADCRKQGSKIMPVDLKRASQGRTATDIDDLQTYLNTGAGSLLDLIRKMRVVLETYCWTTYPASFQAEQDWLGEIVGKIREGGIQHPARALYDELDQINVYTSEYHHGENMADTTPNQIDPQELTGFVKRTLMLVKAL